jgi:hypothetical protein
MNATFNKDEVYLFPAYGRQYFGFAELIQDWKTGKDFSVSGFGGPYCSIRDLELLQKQYTKIFLVNSTMDAKRIS